MVESGGSGKRERVRARASGLCEYCQSQERFATGGDDLDNLCFACQGCNNHKYTKTKASDPVNGEVSCRSSALRRRAGQRSRRFSSTVPDSYGSRQSDRATCHAADGKGNMRRVLFRCGEHPPADLEMFE